MTLVESPPSDSPLGGARGRQRPLLLPLISELYIVTKDSQLVRLGTVLKPAQLDFIARCQKQLDTTGQIRACVLKARQLGLSTVIEAIMFVLAMLYAHMNGIVVSHEKDSATHILNMTRNYWNTFVYQRWHEERYNGRTHLSWSNSSDIHIATAKNQGAGRSTTLQVVHASEVAFWPNPKTIMDSLGNAVPTFGLNAIFLESTANGVGNWFYDQCNMAMKGTSEYEFFFYPWFLEPEYTAAYLPPGTVSKYLLNRPLEDPDEAAEEEWLRDVMHIPEERLIWRRWHIANKCGGDLNKFHQEMPTTPAEAFVSTGNNVFSMPKLTTHYRPMAGVKGKLAKINGKVRFVEDSKGWFTIFGYPSSDLDWGIYLVGGDPTHAPGGDYACMQVINRRTLEQVAVYRRKTHPVQFGRDMQLLGYYYNEALVAPEKEGPGYATVGNLLTDNYPYIYATQRIDKTPGKKSGDDVYGWSTNSQTKELAIAHLVKLFNEPLVQIGNATYGLVIHDEQTLTELRDFVTLDRGLGYGNADGSEYDDGVMALAIAAAVHEIEVKPPPYEEISEYQRPARSGPITGIPSGAAIEVGTSLPIDNQIVDEPTSPPDETPYDDIAINESPAPWETWNTKDNP